jgi:hypothetical protein
MKTDVIMVTSSGDRMEKALEQAEKVAAYKGLSHKNALHLRLLTEETMSMMRSVAGDAEGKFWIEDNQDVFEIHLQMETDVDETQRKQLLSASSSGKNEASRGLMGNIRSFFEPMDGLPVFFNAALITDSPVYTDMSWSMRLYQEQLQAYLAQKREGAAEAWDELEKSVVSNIADDVKVSILGRDVEMVIFKKMA